ncbi:hypothetical protein WR25_22190 [Diploscapter pachys]|uniref:G-protein coupled receptors family 1 profile domain-containing protein n=1 Tax=Diploscapter pachys TaxID=2018661 RepID=A0A2A2LPZ1_9BILA|nr:hypothetical protein WR25_22190 [Diploscapter pachys]
MNETSAESLSDASSAESFLAELLKITTQAAPVLLESDEESRCLPTNASCACHTLYEPYDPLDVVVIGLVALPLFVFGLIANITSVRIFTHRLMASSPINWYLAVLSVSDTFILISSFFVLTLPRLGEFMTWWRANFISYSVSPLMFGMMNLSQTIR